MMTDQEGYSRTQAYKFLKNLLGVPKNVLIRKDFFNLFFQEADSSVYLPRKPEEVIQAIFTEKGIREINMAFHQKKCQENIEEARQLYSTLVKELKELIAA
jgi:hypothetical protein